MKRVATGPAKGLNVRKRDASDVVTGPIGSATLRDPASAGIEGADLSQLPQARVRTDLERQATSTNKQGASNHE